MPDPTNISKATATDIGTTLPFTVTQDANIAGVTQDLWFKYSKQSGDGVFGALADGTGGGYGPETIMVLDDDTEFILGDPNTPIQFSFATAFEPTIWLKAHNVGGNHVGASLTFNLQRGTNTTVAIGDIFIPDDQTEGTGFPGAILNPTTGAVKNFVADCPNGEAGDIVSTGEMLLQNVGDTTAGTSTTPSFKLLGPDFALIASFAYTYTAGTIDRPISRTSDNAGFYAVDFNGTATWPVWSITKAGVKTVLDSITATTLITAICPNVAKTVLYLSGKTGANDSVIYQWDLVGHAYGANFAASVAGYIACHGILTLSNSKVVALYQKNTVTRDILVRVYDSGGSTLVSRSFGSSFLSGISRLFYDAVDPTYVWLRTLNTGNTVTYYKLKTADLTDAITPFTTQSFQEGVNVSGAADPDRFGSSITCAGLILRTASLPETATYPLRRQRRFLLPSSDSNFKMNIPDIEILIRTGIGLKPDSWTPDTATPLGADPQVMFRMSKDGGETWTNERWISAGQRGQRERRVRLVRATGDYRNGVLEVTVDAPVDWQFISALGTPREGTS